MTWWGTSAEVHAALNDLPPALLLASVVFDLLGSATRRDALKAAGYWTLVAAAAGAVAALASGLLAERTIEHGAAVHAIIERHALLAKFVTGGIVALALWRVWRRGAAGSQERRVYLGAATIIVALVAYVAHLGGTIVFRHAGGVPTSVLQSALDGRAAGHQHAGGNEHEHPDADSATAVGTEVDAAASGQQPSTQDSGHTHAPGTPDHRH